MSEIDLATFLRQIASAIEEKKLKNEDLLKVSEFYMEWKMLNEKPNKTLVKKNEPNTDDINLSDKEFLKFFTLGWYVYTQILK